MRHDELDHPTFQRAKVWLVCKPTSPTSAAAGDGAAPYMASAMLTGTNQVPTPLETNTTAYFHIAIGKNSSVWALLVDGIANFTMSHLHYVSTAHAAVGVLLAPLMLPPTVGSKLTSLTGKPDRQLPILTAPDDYCIRTLARQVPCCSVLPATPRSERLCLVPRRTCNL